MQVTTTATRAPAIWVVAKMVAGQLVYLQRGHMAYGPCRVTAQTFTTFGAAVAAGNAYGRGMAVPG
jgi:hypothetical protein